MHYKTIVLHLLEQRPRFHNQLQHQRKVLATLNQHALDLKARHEYWKSELQKRRPNSDPAQIASEALELALQELLDRLPNESPEEMDDPLSLEAGMTFLRRHTPSE